MKLRLIVASLLCAVTLYGQGSSTPLYNAVLQSDLNAAGFKILTADLSDYAGANMTWNVATGKFDATGGGGSGTVTSITATTPMIVTPDPIIATGNISLDPTYVGLWTDAYGDRLKWDGGATGLTAATGRTSLGLVIGANVEAWLGNPSVNGYVLSSTTGGVRSWIAPSGGAPTTVDYLVGTADAGLSAEIVVGTSPGGELGGTWASPTLDDGITVANWTLTTPTIAAISNLTTNGFIKTGGAIGTLSVDTATYQPSDSDLTTWAGVTPTSGIQTWLATPSSANLRTAVTDENGTGVLLFSGAVSPVFSGATQFWNGATSSGEIRILEDSDFGTNYASFVLPAAGITANTAYTLPPDDGNSGDFLRSDGAGVLTWVAPAGGGNVSNSGTPTVDQLGIWVTATTIKGLTTLPATNFPALTGDVTTTAGALGTTIGANKVTLGMMATMATDSILGRATASTGNVEVLASLPFAWSGGDVARAADSNTETINTNAVTYAKMQDVTATSRFLGRITAGAGDPEELTAANAKTILALTSSDVGLGNVTNNAQTQSAIVPNTAPSAGQILAGNAGGTAYAPVTVSGSGATISLASTGVMTIGSIANASLDADLAAIGNITGVRGDVLFYGASGWARLGVGTSGQQLTTGGAGADPAWAAAGSGGGTPGGSNTEVQFNDSSAFGGDSAMTWDKTNNILTLAGSTTTATFKIGTLEFQDYGLSNAWIGENAIFDGAWKYRATGPAGLFYFFGTEGQFRFFASGTGGAGLTSAGNVTQFKVNSDGTVGMGGVAMSTGAGTYTGSKFLVKGATTQIGIAGDHALGWSGTSGDAAATIDAALSRNAAGVLEVNNGTAGTYRDLKVDEIDAVTGYKIGGTPLPFSGGTTGQVMKKNSSTDYDWSWAADAGGGAGSGDVVGPASATDNAIARFDTTTGKLIQDSVVTIADTTGVMSNAGTAPGISATGAATNIGLKFVAKADADFTFEDNPGASGTRLDVVFNNTHGTTKSSNFTFSSNGTPLWALLNDLGANGITNDFALYDSVTPKTMLYCVGNDMRILTTTLFGWGAQSGGIVAAPDLALARNAAGVLEVNNGTAAQYRDIKVDEVDAVTGYKLNGTTINLDYSNTSVTNQTPSTSDVYLAGSNIVLPAGGFKANGQYRCLFDVVKSAGTGTIVLTVRIGTAGTTGDTSRMTFTFPAGTSVADTGNMEVIVNWRTVGSGTSAVISGLCRAQKNLITAAGLWNNTSAVFTIVGTVSSGFDSSTATTMGVSFNGGTAFAGTITTVQSNLFQK